MRQNHPSLSIGHIAMLHPIITATEIAMQALAIVRVHCNEGTGTGAIPIIYKTYYKVTLI